MTKKTTAVRTKPAHEANAIDALYVEFVKRFYDDENRGQAEKIAAKLENAMNASASLAESIRGEEIRALIAELRGDYHYAVRSREAEIRKILELHTLAVNTPSWPYVSSQYDYSDVSDRLDLLAILYDRLGETDRAVATLRESRQYCQSHQIPFDGQDLLTEFEQGRNGPPANGVRRRKPAR
jgi:hypothetical protein